MIYLHEIDVLHKHQLLLDGAMIGNVELMKYAESKGEDILYYKALIYILNNPKNPARQYIICRMLRDVSDTDRATALTEMLDKKLITDDEYNLVLGYPVPVRHKFSRWLYIPILGFSCALVYYVITHFL